MTEPRKIGFVGLGSMGLPMARNLVGCGFAVHGYDADARRMTLLEEAGGSNASSATDAASEAGVLVLMVVNAAQAEAILFQDSALQALPLGGIVLLMSTCAPQEVERLAQRVEEQGRRLVDAPVSGGVVGAVAADLTIMVGAPDALLDSVRPILSRLGKRIFHAGQKPGHGAALKSINQLLCGVHLAAAAEALAFGRSLDIDPRVALDVVVGSAASSWMLRDRGPRMLEANPEITSAVDIFVKDLGIVLEGGRSAKAYIPLAAAAHQMFLATSASGLGGNDDSQVIQSYLKLTSPFAE